MKTYVQNILHSLRADTPESAYRVDQHAMPALRGAVSGQTAHGGTQAGGFGALVGALDAPLRLGTRVGFGGAAGGGQVAGGCPLSADELEVLRRLNLGASTADLALAYPNLMGEWA